MLWRRKCGQIVGKLSTTSLRRHRKWWLWLRQLSPRWPNSSGWRIRAMYPEKSWKLRKWSNLRRSKASNVWEDWLWVEYPDLWCQLWIHKPLVRSKRRTCLGLKILLQPLVTLGHRSIRIPRHPQILENMFQILPALLVIESLRKKWARNHWFIHWKWSFLHTFPILTVSFPFQIATSRHLLMFPCIGLFPSLESAQVAGRFQGGTERCPSFGSPWAVWHFAEWRAFDMR